jgi:Xaa-Pro aminopeptidase
MLTAEGCRGRRARLWDALPEKPDCIVLSSPRHLAYFANFYASPFMYKAQNGRAILLLHANGNATIVVDNVQRSFAEEAFIDEVVGPVWYDGSHSAGSRDQILVRAAADQIARLSPDLIGFEPAVLGGVLHEGVTPFAESVDVVPTLFTMQRSKDPDEIDLLRRSILAGEAGHKAAIEGIKPGMTELQAYQLVADAAMVAIGEQAIVYGDFASGPNAEKGGGGPTGRKIEKNDLFILDYSVVVRGYRGDFTNTFIVGGGHATPKQKELETACLEALAAGEKLLDPGASCRAIDQAVRSVLLSHNASYTLRHHVGHGLGLGHPDPPYFVAESSETLQAGDVVTLEPGQYHAGIGGMRFEHNYLITDAGYERLTNHFVGLEPRA